MIDLRYSEILKLNKQLEDKLESDSYDITVLSNIIVHQIKEILEYALREKNINAEVNIGNYDNIVQDSKVYQKSKLIIIFWELCNIFEGLQYKIELFNDSQFDEIINKIKAEIDLILKNLKNTNLLLINRFTSLQFSSFNIGRNNLDKLVLELNLYLGEKTSSNIRLVNHEKVMAALGIENSLDWRYFYSSKALYTVDFYKSYVEHIKPFIMSANGNAKKVLVFDCDNTLWQGILGEDGFDKIEMSTKTKEGSIFAEIQSIALGLSKKGILLCLCSKNNYIDVNKVIQSHPDMQLRDDNIIIKKVNWIDKVSNIKAIAEDLNLGLDSIVFIDDSSFEVNLIREKLPEVMVMQVPERLYDYPSQLRALINEFYSLSSTVEDSKKVNMYKNQIKRDSIKNEFSNIEDYLASLGLRVTISENDSKFISRISQMTQKTNQFNLTTKRYTEVEIKKFINDSDINVYAFSVSDKFDDSGLTGLGIIKYNETTSDVEIDTFLMSCRIIGRNIEYIFMNYLIKKIKEKNQTALISRYIKTLKNEQVKEFFDKCSFCIVKEDELIKNYTLSLDSYVPFKIDYIEVIDGQCN